jgi:hypothetical protein
MKTLVLGAAYGYKPAELAPFVVSLRRHYQGDVLFITGELDQESVNFFNQHNIITFELGNVFLNPRDIQLERYGIYKSLLEENFNDAERVLLCDVRDVVFQDDPFKFPAEAELEFFHEPALYSKCQCNGGWIKNVFGEERYDQLKDEWIICSGTTLATGAGIMKYIDTMIEEIERVKQTGIHMFSGVDQPIHAHLAYTDSFPDQVKHHNGEGPIVTLHHQLSLTVDRQGRILNKNREVVPIVHQWDRMGRLKYMFEETAINGPGPAPEV